MQQVTAVDERPLPMQAQTPKRAHALDALRGLAILAMILSAVVPSGTLPGWMYHAQNPPPLHDFDPNLPGITWVDLVFPFFLFSMGAAIPLALSRRLERGTSLWKIIGGIAWRGVLLAAFAHFRDHVAPYSMSGEPGVPTWLAALAGMALVFLVWGRFPAHWKPWLRNTVHAAGWLGAVVLLASIRYPDGGNWGWSVPAMRQWVQRVDIIILVLANVSVAASLIWLFTRHSWWARLVPAGLMLALKISASAPGWAQQVWAWTPADWLYRMEFMKYLLIVVPATIVGDLLLGWMRGPSGPAEDDGAPATPAWHAGRLGAAGILAFTLSALAVIGFGPVAAAQAERPVVETTLGLLAIVGVMGGLMRAPRSELERLLARLYQWGAWWLALGLFFEPYEGGIQKGRPTIAYFFVTLGLAAFMLLAFTVLIEGFGKRRWVQLLIDNGQNPLLAYIGYSNFIQPLVVMSGLFGLVASVLTSPWQGALHAFLLTLLLALFVSLCTRLKVFVRA